MVKSLSAPEVKALLENETEIVLLDVREQWEYDLVHIPGARLAPLSEFREHFASLDKNAKTIVYCHHGSRSLNACAFLAGNGFREVYNLEGGINSYSAFVDPSLATY
jgi:rhodanese-related sulfurtransferase